MSRAALQRLSPVWSNSRIHHTINVRLDNEGFLRKILDASAASVTVFDQSGELLYVSEAWRTFATQHGFTRVNDAYGLFRLQSCPDVPGRGAAKQIGLRESIQQIITDRQAEFQEEYVLEDLETPRWFKSRVNFMDVADGFLVLVTLEDITRRHLAEEELRNIGGRLINAQEEERKRLARELHDDLSQQMALLSFEIDQLRPLIPQNQDPLGKSVKLLSKRVREICGDIHRLSYQLHPFKLEHLGLSAAIESICVELSMRQQLSIKFRDHGFPAQLPADITLCAFRIAQESLHNVVKHSGASEAQVVVTKNTNELRLLVSDNGCGFDIEQAKKKKRLGLISIRERLRLVGGDLSIRTQPNKGTRIEVCIPLAVGPRRLT